MRTRAELRAMLASQGSWARWGNDTDERYSKPLKGSKWPDCGFCKPAIREKTHIGMSNGVALMSGCEFHVAMWVRNPDDLRGPK